MADFVVKQGNSFELLCTYVDALDVPQDIGQIAIAADVANAAGVVLCSLAVVRLQSTGQFVLKATPAQTLTWPFVGNLAMDIRYSMVGVVVSTKTLTIAVAKAVTVR